jgi:hypothetical protein
MLLDPGSAGMEQKIRIRDKHPESATLQAMLEKKVNIGWGVGGGVTKLICS